MPCHVAVVVVAVVVVVVVVVVLVNMFNDNVLNHVK